MSKGYWYKTKDIIKALEDKRGGVYLAADSLGCSAKTIQRRARSNPKIAAVIAKYRGIRSDVAEMKLDQALWRGESWAIMFQLRTQGKDRGYVERQEITGSEGGPVVIVEWEDAGLRDSD